MTGANAVEWVYTTTFRIEPYFFKPKISSADTSNTSQRFAKVSMAGYLSKRIYLLTVEALIPIRTVLMIVLEPLEKYFTVLMMSMALGLLSSLISIDEKCEEYYKRQHEKEKLKTEGEEYKLSKKDILPIVVFGGCWFLVIILTAIFKYIVF